MKKPILMILLIVTILCAQPGPNTSSEFIESPPYQDSPFQNKHFDQTTKKTLVLRENQPYFTIFQIAFNRLTEVFNFKMKIYDEPTFQSKYTIVTWKMPNNDFWYYGKKTQKIKFTEKVAPSGGYDNHISSFGPKDGLMKFGLELKGSKDKEAYWDVEENPENLELDLGGGDTIKIVRVFSTPAASTMVFINMILYYIIPASLALTAAFLSSFSWKIELAVCHICSYSFLSIILLRTLIRYPGLFLIWLCLGYLVIVLSLEAYFYFQGDRKKRIQEYRISNSSLFSSLCILSGLPTLVFCYSPSLNYFPFLSFLPILGFLADMIIIKKKTIICQTAVCYLIYNIPVIAMFYLQFYSETINPQGVDKGTKARYSYSLLVSSTLLIIPGMSQLFRKKEQTQHNLTRDEIEFVEMGDNSIQISQEDGNSDPDRRNMIMITDREEQNE